MPEVISVMPPCTKASTAAAVVPPGRVTGPPYSCGACGMLP
jgi:hypothetical protein